MPIVEFLVQNNQRLDALTCPPVTQDAIGCNTALHLCAIYDKVECMKLLLRSGADPQIRNSEDKTAMDIAQDMGHHTCYELVISTDGLDTFICHAWLCLSKICNNV